MINKIIDLKSFKNILKPNFSLKAKKSSNFMTKDSILSPIKLDNLKSIDKATLNVIITHYLGI